MIAVTIAFLAGMVCGAATMVTIFVFAIVKMHNEQQSRPAAVKIAPVILHDSGELN